jgi:hypothetical protein
MLAAEKVRKKEKLSRSLFQKVKHLLTTEKEGRYTFNITMDFFIVMKIN